MELHKLLKELWEITTTLFSEENPDTSTEWGWKIENDTLYLNFQGSVSKLDWKQNFDFLQVPYKNMPHRFKVHRGFLTKWKSIQAEVIKVIRDHKPKQIVITGFSQGAALATLCHEDLVFHGHHPETWAFGSPRVFGWKVPGNRFANLTRVSYAGDIITGMAPWFFGFRHVGREYGIGRWPRFLRIRPDFHMKFFTHDWED